MDRKLSLSLASLLLVAPLATRAATFQIDLSPGSGALNLGSTTYTQDHAVGIAAANETSPPASAATGNELGSGIFFDDASNLLTFDMGYGSAFGFVDLASDWNGGVHFHAPGAVNYPSANGSGGVIVSLSAFHTASGTRSGRITGSVTLSAGQETQLFDNLIYLNIHSVSSPGGEIRGQLVVVPEPRAALLAAAGLAALAIASRRRIPR